jgi:hypothetical protein
MTREWVFKYIMLNWRAKRYVEAETELLKLLKTSKEDGYTSVHYDCHYYLGTILVECHRSEEALNWFRAFFELCNHNDEFSNDYKKKHKRFIAEASRRLGYTKSWFKRLISKFQKS